MHRSRLETCGRSHAWVCWFQLLYTPDLSKIWAQISWDNVQCFQFELGNFSQAAAAASNTNPTEDKKKFNFNGNLIFGFLQQNVMLSQKIPLAKCQFNEQGFSLSYYAALWGFIWTPRLMTRRFGNGFRTVVFQQSVGLFGVLILFIILVVSFRDPNVVSNAAASAQIKSLVCNWHRPRRERAGEALVIQLFPLLSQYAPLFK